MKDLKKVFQNVITTIRFYQEKCNLEGMYSANKQPVVINTISEVTEILASLNNKICPICYDGNLYSAIHTSCDSCGTMCEGLDEIIFNKNQRELASNLSKDRLINVLIGEIDSTTNDGIIAINVLYNLRNKKC